MSSSNAAKKATSSDLKVKRYSSYGSLSRLSRDTKEKPNFIVEHAAPAFLYLLSKVAVQSSAYTPFSYYYHISPLVGGGSRGPASESSGSGGGIAVPDGPHGYSLRPQSHISEQVLMDFYRLVGGSYNTPAPNPSHIPMSSSSVEDAVAGTTPGHGGSSSAASSSSGPSSSAGSAAVAAAAAMAAGTDAFRLSQMKKNSRHIDNHFYHRVCSFYQTREGCRRGVHCEYLHIEKNGSVIPNQHI